jgi:hypothetical protein
MVTMLTPNTTLIVLGLGALAAAAAALYGPHRHYLESRRDQRLCHLLRTGVLSIEGVEVRDQGRDLAWQECETTTGRRG